MNKKKLMIFKKNIAFQSFIIILCILIIHCSNKKELEERENLLHLNKNLGSTSIKLKLDLEVFRMSWYPSCLAIDDEGKIYVFDNYIKKIYIYNKQGNEIGQKEFNQGQGPGDINFMDPAFSSEGNLHIYDKKLGRLNAFSKNLELLDTRELKKEYNLNFLFFISDSTNNLYFWAQKRNFIDDKYTPSRVLAKLSHSGKLLKEIFEYEDEADVNALFDAQNNIQYISLYPRFGTFKLDVDDFLYYAISDKYEINVISPQGEFDRKIIGTKMTRNVTKEDTESYISESKKALSKFGYKLEFIIPERMPAIADFFVFENKYILVVTYENQKAGSVLWGDLFDNEGNFISKVDIPKYSRWGDWNGLFKKGAIYKKNYLYTIENKEGDKNVVKRYRIDWNWGKSDIK